MNEIKNKTGIDKPFSLVYEDFKMGLANLINNSGLPMFVIESVLQNYINEVKDIAKQQYMNDKARYESSLSKKDDEEKEEEE